MSAPIARPDPPRLALNISEACACLGISADVFKANVEPELKIVRLGRRVLIPTNELARWLDANAERIG